MEKIKYLWLLLSILLLLNSCSGLRSVRHSRIISPKQNNISKKIDNDNISSNKNNQIEEVKNEQNSNNIDTDDYTKLANIVGSRIPTLREQMQFLSKTQDSIKYDISEVKNEIQQIKNLITDLRAEIDDYFPAGEKLPMTGYNKDKNFYSNNNSNNSQSTKLLSDEKINSVPKQQTNIAKTQNIKNKAINETYLVSDEKAKQTKVTTKTVKNKPSTIPNNTHNNNTNNNNNLSDNSQLLEGKSLYSKKDYSNAIEVLNNALKSETSKTQEAEINFLIGESYYFLTNYDKAIEFMNKVISTPGNQYIDGARIRKAEANLKSGKVSEAKEDYQALIRNHPTSNFVPQARKMLQQL